MELLAAYIALCMGCYYYLGDLMTFAKQFVLDMIKLEEGIDNPEDEAIIRYLLQVIIFIMSPVILYNYWRDR